MAFNVGLAKDPDDTVVITSCADVARLNLGRYIGLAENLADEGLWLPGRGVWYVTAAHGDAELHDALATVDPGLSVLAE